VEVLAIEVDVDAVWTVNAKMFGECCSDRVTLEVDEALTGKETKYGLSWPETNCETILDDRLPAYWMHLLIWPLTCSVQG
jgi:hypothetical protein